MHTLCLLLVTLAPVVLGDDLLTVATNNGCGKLVNAIQSAGLADTLRAANGVTLFAPNDDALGRLPSAVLHQLENNSALLADVLKFHVVNQVARAADIRNDLLLPTLADSGIKMRMNVYETTEVDVWHDVIPEITVRRNKTVVTAEGSQVIKTDLTADNGLVHVIDKVIYPLPAINLPLTLTFDKDLGSLAYLILQGNLTMALSMTAEGSQVIKTDLAADNGLVHVIDKIIFPLPAMNLPLTLTFDKDLGSVGLLIYQGNLTVALSSEPFTVFAPSNAAFNKLPGQIYNDLLMNVTKLQEVLFTHVVKGVVFSKGLTGGESLTNLQGTQLPIAVGGNGVQVNHVHVTKADTPATNGVIHVIDTVMLPK